MYLLIKPASGACDLGCRYCFYSDEMSCRSHAVRGVMSYEIADIIFDKAIERCMSKTPPEPLSIGFQGGEPLLAGLDFFRHVCEHVETKLPRVGGVNWFLQTNGTHMDYESAVFFAEHRFLVGLSVDGPKEYHDKCRVTREGKSVFNRVMRAADNMRRAGVDFNTLTVVTSASAAHAQALYGFFERVGFRYQQYIPCIAPLGSAEGQKYELTADEYVDFLCKMFDLWYAGVLRGEGSYVYNRDFENWVGILAGRQPEECGMCGVCAEQYLIESDGSVYPCDFYALDEYCLGNLKIDSFEDIDAARERLKFIESSCTLPERCRNCRWRGLCRNGCRRNRQGGEPSPYASFDFPGGVNRFCTAYSRFFEYSYPRMQELADMIRRRG